MDVEFALEQFGLSENEICVYLALLRMGTVKLQELAKHVDMARTTIYNTLNYLESHGLVSYSTKDGVRVYTAASPQRLADILAEKHELIESVLPQLSAMKQTIDTSSVEVYRGISGVSTILSRTFENPSDLCYFGSYALSQEVLSHLPERYRTIRFENGIRARIAIEECDEEIFSTPQYQAITDMRFHNGLAEFPCMIFIYGDTTALYTLRNGVLGLIIQDAAVASAMRMIFEMYWESGKDATLLNEC